MLGMLWLFESQLGAYRPVDPQPSRSAPRLALAKDPAWPADWPAPQPFLLAQEVREIFRHADAKRDAGTPVRDIASLPKKQLDDES
ncbi:hypothetical protein CEK28_09775 [Xenophilus sp. AP218F]|nr:hypothetical protein [Chromobacterium sp. ASV5]OWY39158.1 hypothetical protein CEK28_09775 [Xenophilus sp. AP218F]